MRIQNANQLSGQEPTGCDILRMFWNEWLFLALAAKQIINPATVAATMTGMTGLLIAAALLLRQAKALAARAGRSGGASRVQMD